MRAFARCLVVLTMVMAGCLASMGCSAEQDSGSTTAGTVRIGTMPTEDMLPGWVALEKGCFQNEGIDVQIETFDSAQSLSAAITAGQVDMAMTDVMRAVKLCESGTPVVAEWVTLGTQAAQGRFGVLAPAHAEYDTLSELAAWVRTQNADDSLGVGVAANTVPEYVFDRLCAEEGVAAGSIPTQEVASLPERYGLVVSGKLAGAALPNSLLTLGEANGLKVIADDTQGANVSQSIMVARASFAEENAEAVLAVARAWDAAVADIDADPSAFKEMLFENANISTDLSDGYGVSEYPLVMEGDVVEHPAADLVDPQIAWMQEKGYGGEGVSYDSATGAFSVS